MTAKQVQIRRDSATNLNATTPADGELAYDTTNDQLRIGDGVTAGGIRIPNSKMLQNGTMTFATAGGTADALTITLSPVPSAYVTGMGGKFLATATNATTTPTINVNSIGAKNLKKKTASGKANPAVGDIQSGCVYDWSYDGTDVQVDSVGVTATTPTGALLNVDFYTCTQSTFTVTIASPAVLTIQSSAEGRRPANGCPVRLTTTGALPTGLALSTTYYVTNSGVDGSGKFRLSATKGGADINTSGSQSGTHTIKNAPFIKATNNPSFIEVELVGAGGTTSGNQGGSGSGGYAYKKIPASSLSASEVVDTASQVSGASSFFGISVGNGQNGAGSTTYQGGAGGTGDNTGISDFTTAGQNGGTGSANAHGSGGATKFGGYGPGSGAGSTTTAGIGWCGCVCIREYS